MKVSGLFAMIKNRANRNDLYSSARYWDSKALELEGDAVSMWPNNHLNRLYISEQLSLVDSELPDIQGKKVLDVGCGTGRMARYLSSRGAQVTGVDFSSNAIQIAKGLSVDDDAISYEVQSIFDINYQDEFDFVFSWGCVAIAAKNKQELHQALCLLNRSLKPGAKLLMLEPIHSGFVHRVLDMNIEEFCQEMERAGFSVHKVSQMHFWPMRYLLCFLPLPKFITSPLYWFGQKLMHMPLLNKMGDYKAVSAVVSTPYSQKDTAGQ